MLNETRDLVLGIRLTGLERQSVRRAARQAGVSESTWARDRLVRLARALTTGGEFVTLELDRPTTLLLNQIAALAGQSLRDFLLVAGREKAQRLQDCPGFIPTLETKDD